MRLASNELARIVEADNNSRDFEQCIGLAIETTRFDIDNDRQETAKAVRHMNLSVH